MHLDELPAWEALMAPGEPFDRLLEATRNRPEWMARGACRDHPEVDFFPAPGRGIPADVAPALAVCAGCPVVDECRAHAEVHGEAGIWGGLTARERRARSAA